MGSKPVSRRTAEFYYPDFDKAMNILILCRDKALNKSEISRIIEVRKRDVVIDIVDMLVERGLLRPVRERRVWTRERVRTIRLGYPRFTLSERGAEFLRRMEELLHEYLGATPERWIRKAL